MYFSVVLHHDAVDGCGALLELSDWMKSTIMDRWIGVNLPYQIKFTVKLPLRSWPVWYLRMSGCCLTKAESLRVVAEEGWGKVEKRRRREVKREKKLLCTEAI